ncbi:MAG: DUF4388 domain-containing protein [Anaeromyxobacteraceae bacterium]
MRLKLEVGPEGEITVPPHEAEALGLAGGGPVELVSARGACTLIVPAREDAPTNFFAGTLSSLTVGEVVQSIFTSLKSGVLLLGFPGEGGRQRRRSLYFRDGQIVYASSSDPRDRLGPVLVRKGLITDEALKRASQLVKSGRPLGQVLVDEGVLTPARLYEGVSAQVKELFLASFEEVDGKFAFLEGQTDEASSVKLPERMRDLLLEGMRRLEAAEQRRLAAAPPPDEEELVVEVEPPAPVHHGPFETYRRILKHVHGALASHAPDAVARINGWFEGLPATKRPLFQGVVMSAAGELETTKVLENANATGTHPGAAGRARALEALEELLSFVLFEAKNRLPKAEAERLVREVGRMQMGKA